jgi:hypothetical protein
VFSADGESKIMWSEVKQAVFDFFLLPEFTDIYNHSRKFSLGMSLLSNGRLRSDLTL